MWAHLDLEYSSNKKGAGLLVGHTFESRPHKNQYRYVWFNFAFRFVSESISENITTYDEHPNSDNITLDRLDHVS
jgi:hypothetical protein